MKMHPALLQQLTAAAAEVVAGLEAAGLQPTHSALAVAFEQIVQAMPAAAPPGARAPAAAAAAAAPIGPGQAQQRFYSGVLLSHMSSATSPRPAGAPDLRGSAQPDLGRAGSQLLEFEQELATALSLSAAEGDRTAQLELDGEQTDINLAMAISASLSPAPAPSRVNTVVRSVAGPAAVDEAAVTKLVGLGFETAAARQALEAAGGSEELAIEILFG